MMCSHILSHVETIVCTKITEVNLSVFVYRVFHEIFSPIVGAN